MAKTRGAKSSSPWSHLRVPRDTPPSSEPPSDPQPSQTPATESQIPSSMTPEVVIRRPMVTQPPIEGNFDCRARPFHSKLCFDTATFRLQPELKDSFHLLQSIGLLSVYDYTPGPDPTVIHFTIDGRHGIVGARHIAEALCIPYEPTSRGLSSLDSSFPERHSSYSVQRGIHMPVSVEEVAPS
ncbi:hypothetical protein AAG906_003078 [Vitis piasezkii]